VFRSLQDLIKGTAVRKNESPASTKIANWQSDQLHPGPTDLEENHPFNAGIFDLRFLTRDVKF
jgi:hypothetical protein